MASAQFQFQFVYLPFFSHKCGAENVERENRNQRKMGVGRRKACAFFLGCKRPGESPGLGLLSSERCRAHCPRRGLSQVNKPKATEKVRPGRRKRENREQKGRGWSQLHGRRRVGRGQDGPTDWEGPWSPRRLSPACGCPTSCFLRCAGPAFQSASHLWTPPRAQDSQSLRPEIWKHRPKHPVFPFFRVLTPAIPSLPVVFS